MSQESYARAARLVYITRYTIEGPKAALIQAHRLAASAVAAHPDDDDAAVREALRSTMDVLGPRRSRRRLFGGPRLVPVDVTEAQREVLDHIKVRDGRVAAAAVFRLLEGTSGADAAAVLDPEDPARGEERIQQAVTDICGDREPGEIRELLLGRELDPIVVPVSAQATLSRRRRRFRDGSVATVAIVALAAAGVWWFGVRTPPAPPLGSRADDPVIQVSSAMPKMAAGLDAWPARGELLGDTALLRRAADDWHARGLPYATQPQVLFAGRLHNVSVVVMTGDYPPTGFSSSVAVYAEGLRGKSPTRLAVNPYSEGAPTVQGGIRLLDIGAFDTDPILLPPGASDVETGPLDTPSVGWKPAHPDARGVIEVPAPETAQQNRSTPYWSPSGGIRFKDSNDAMVLGSSATVAETFYDTSPVLPVVQRSDQYEPALSQSDWCALRKQAEQYNPLGVAYSEEQLKDVASGPLPDGGGTGYVMERYYTGPQREPLRDAAVLAQPNPGCASAMFQADQDITDYASFGPTDQLSSYTSDTADAVVWTSPAKHTYLVVAAAPGAAKLRVSGPVSASANGRWLVVPVTDVINNQLEERPLVEAFDAAGHRCGDPDPHTATKNYCS